MQQLGKARFPSVRELHESVARAVLGRYFLILHVPAPSSALWLENRQGGKGVAC